MTRACVVTLKFATARKRRKLAALVEAHRGAVAFYIRSLWTTSGHWQSKETKARLPLDRTRLNYTQRGVALKQAWEIVTGTRKAEKATGKKASRPCAPTTAKFDDPKLVRVESGRGSFDLVVRPSSLVKGRRLVIPTKKTPVLNKWLSMPGAKLRQGCLIRDDSLVLWVEIPDRKPKTSGKVVGLDLGVNKLVTTSTRRHYGREFKAVLARVRRCGEGLRQRQKGKRIRRGRQPLPKGYRRALVQRDNYINETLNRLPWRGMNAVGVEDLRGLKRGKSRKRGKSFRKALAPWTYRRVLARLGHKAEENRVRLVPVPAAYTSQSCPECGTVHEDNRKGEDFLCVSCGHRGDADVVGARNVLARTLQLLGRVKSPGPEIPCVAGTA